jgi:SRSO17 transposase
MAQKTSEIATAARLEDFFGRVDRHLKDSRKRESFAMYAFGVLGDGERKSAEPIAARACPDPDEVRNVHCKLLHFLGRSVWDDRAVRLEAARYAIETLQEREPITTWIIDDTGFLKQGKDSVGGTTAIHGLGRQDHQLPNRRQSRNRDQQRASAARFRAVSAKMLG